MRGSPVASLPLVLVVAGARAEEPDDALQRPNGLPGGGDPVAARCGAGRKCSRMTSCEEACLHIA